ncbi:hypothetical protein DFH06DRAFT_1189201 [Mycena polygramma]|nr:hypothetical protein DFH06DRAFT_1189201 [Mycena polygramma]
MRNGASAAPAGSAGRCGATTSLLYGPTWCVPYGAAYSRRTRSLCGRGRDGGAGGLRMWAVLTCVSLDFCGRRARAVCVGLASCGRRFARGGDSRGVLLDCAHDPRRCSVVGSIAGTASRRPARISRWLASRSAGVQNKVLGWLTRDHRYCGGAEEYVRTVNEGRDETRARSANLKGRVRRIRGRCRVGAAAGGAQCGSHGGCWLR